MQLSFLVHLRLLALLALSLLLCACGGESSSVDLPQPSGARPLEGFVEDGPVAGARVFLRMQGTDEIARLCGSSGNGRCETLTDQNGRFSLLLHGNVHFPALVAVAVGGSDTQTGVDFSSIEMRAPLVLVDAAARQLAITPLTTLLAEKIERRMQPEEAVAQVRHLLALPAAQDLGARPSTDPVLQHRALLLTKIAVELARAGVAHPLLQILDDLGAQPLFAADGAPRDAALQSLARLDGAARARIHDFTHLLTREPPSAWGQAFQRHELHQALLETLTLMLAEGDDIDRRDERFLANAEFLNQRILDAAGRHGLVLSAPAPRRLIRYVLFSYELNSAEAFLLPPDEFHSRLARLDEDAEIPRLVQSRVRHNRVVPLFRDEFLTTPAQRIDYYYNSDASYFHQAELLLAGLNDADLSDAVMLKILEGKSRHGLHEDARLIADTQIFQTVNRGLGLTTLGESLARHGRQEQALAALHQAHAAFRRVIAAKGWASIANSDAANLQKLAGAFRKAGHPAGARLVLDDLEQAAPHLTTVSLFSRLFIGTRDTVDLYLDEGDFDLAAAALPSLHDYARRTPANETAGKRHYKARIFNLVETAQRHARLGDAQGAWQLYQEIQQLRHHDGLLGFSGTETWVYMDRMVDMLYQIGRKDEALALAYAIPNAYVDIQGITRSALSYRIFALKAVAASLALEEGIAAAEEFISTHLSDPRDRIEAWTYFAGNRKRAYVAEQATETERFDLAVQALLRARALVSTLTEATERNRYRYLVQWGYVKLADLAFRAQDPALALSLLDDAESVAHALTDLEYRVSALVDIARLYADMNLPEQGRTRLDAALAAIQGAAPGLSPSAATNLRELVLGAFEVFVREPLEAYLATARQLYVPGQVYAGTDHDDLAKLKTESLIFAADLHARFGAADPSLLHTARALLAEARATADRIYVPATRMNLYINKTTTASHLIGAQARAKDFATARELALGLPYRGDRHLALQKLAEIYCDWDDLPGYPQASVDTDGDGRPNFFHPWADEIQLLELELDSDSDGDGIPDHLDARPLYPD
ncbi:hypothetical protein [Geoalkalibacter sp.]|uniref:hypothetical protein n=1 Tax=Geoalkalibacter sp. TaxID=3041440 RepID=UPI00272EC996|nr:hypothetical protein [Geoalkalibacter sp.]